MQITNGIIEGAQKVVIYGPEGIGKSTFASRFPNPVFIDTEGSTKRLDVNRTPRPSSWAMLLEQVRYFKANPYLYNTLVIDTADWAEQLCMNEICAKSQKSGIEDFGYGKGYVYLAEDFGRLLNLLEDLIELGVNIVFNAHAQIHRFDQPDEMGSYDRWEMKLQKRTAPLMKEWADMILFANYKTHVINVDGQGAIKGKNKVQGGKRVMYTTHHTCWDAKNRHDLKEELPFEYKEIAHCIITNIGSSPAQATQTPPIQEEIKQETIQVSKSVETQKTVAQKPTETEYGTQEELEEIINASEQLEDLMKENNVTVEEIQAAVAYKEYYPKDTPILNYDPNFISGVLVGAWEQVYEIILTLRKDEIPF